jgi:hypothetical protein
MGGRSLHHLADHLRRDGRLRECVMVERTQPMTETTPLPWSVGLNKTIMGNGGTNFVVYAYATAKCGREGDYYACNRPPVESHLSIKPGDAALLVDAVNSHEALKARIQELRDLIDDIVNYRGGATNALEDQYIMDRANAALQSKDTAK